jgi:hypothetical protein
VKADISRPPAHRRRNFSSPFSPPIKPMPTITPSSSGYTGRRSGEAGPAPDVKKRRKSSRTGFAENGLPPATRAERMRVGRQRRLFDQTQQSAGRACVAHKGKTGSGSHRPLSARWFERAIGNGDGKRHSPIFQSEGPKSRAKTAERGAERCHLLLTYEAAFSAPADKACLKQRLSVVDWPKSTDHPTGRTGRVRMVHARIIPHKVRKRHQSEHMLN